MPVCDVCRSVNAANARTCGSCGNPLVARLRVEVAPEPAPPAEESHLAWLALLAPYVALSSLLGLSWGVGWLDDPAGAFATMGLFWSASPAADLLFVMGSAAAAVGAFLLARRGHVGGAIATGLGATWLTYWLGFEAVLAATDRALPGDAHFLMEIGGGAFLFVAWVGVAGILFAGLAPVVAGRIAARPRPGAGSPPRAPREAPPGAPR